MEASSALRRSSESPANFALLIAQRLNRIDSGRAVCRKAARKDADSGEESPDIGCRRNHVCTTAMAVALAARPAIRPILPPAFLTGRKCLQAHHL